jgi:3-ketoacyl-CoA synthase
VGLVYINKHFDHDSVAFQVKILEEPGFSEENSIHHSLARVPIRTKNLSFSIDEATSPIFSVITDLLKKSNINPKDIDMPISNSTIFSPTRLL